MNSWSAWGLRTPLSGRMEKAVSLSGWYLRLSRLKVSPGIRGCRLGFMVCQWKGSSTCLWGQQIQGHVPVLPGPVCRPPAQLGPTPGVSEGPKNRRWGSTWVKEATLETS